MKLSQHLNLVNSKVVLDMNAYQLTWKSSVIRNWMDNYQYNHINTNTSNVGRHVLL